MDMLEGTEDPHCYGTAIATIALLTKIRGEKGHFPQMAHRTNSLATKFELRWHVRQ